MDIVTVMMVRVICLGVMILGAIAALFLQNFTVGILICGGIVVAAAIVLCVVSLLYWHCPKCGRHLPSNGLMIEYCPHCGKRL